MAAVHAAGGAEGASVRGVRTPSGPSWRCASPRPRRGPRRCGGLDVEQDFSSELLRRAARHLREGDLTAPMAQAPGESAEDGSGPEGDQELRGLLAELIVQAGGEASNPRMLEVQRLQLELARLERGIQRARGQEGTDVAGLAREKAALKVRVRPGLLAGAGGDGGAGGLGARRGRRAALETLRAEARKCVLLCSNCHAEVEGGSAEFVLSG